MACLGVGADRAHADAGIVDDAVEPAEMRGRRRDRGGAGGRRRQLGLDRYQALRPHPERGRQPRQPLRAAVDGGDGMPILQQRRRHHRTEAAGSAGDQDRARGHVAPP